MLQHLPLLHTHTHVVCRTQVDAHVFLNHSPLYFLNRVSPSTWSSSIWLDCLADEPPGPVSPARG